MIAKRLLSLLSVAGMAVTIVTTTACLRSGGEPLNSTEAEDDDAGAITVSKNVRLQSKTISDISDNSDTQIVVEADDGYAALSSVVIRLGSDFLASNICAPSVVFGRTGIATCQSGTTDNPASAADVFAGEEFFDVEGSVESGTMISWGGWDMESEFPGEGYYSGTSNAPDVAELCSGTYVLGMNGSAICQSSTSVNPAGATDVLSGKEFWNGSGSVVSGTMFNRGTWNMTTSFTGAGYYLAISNSPAATGICLGIPVNNTSGTAVCLSGIATNLASEGDVASGFDYWDASGTKHSGTRASLGTWDIRTAYPGSGFLAGVSYLPASSDMCVGTQVDAVAGVAVCQSGTATTPALASHALTSKQFWNSSGILTAGTMADRGSWNLATSFPGSGYVSGISNAPVAGAICNGAQVNAVTGTAVCQSGTATAEAALTDIYTGKQYWDSTGTLRTGTMADRGTWNMTSAFPGAGYYAGVSGAPAAGVICTSSTLNGTNGSAVCQSGTATNEAATGDVLASNEYWDSTGTKQTGTMVNRATWDFELAFAGAGYYSALIQTPPYGSYCSDVQIAGAYGTAVCQGSAGSGSEATASQLCSGRYLWNSSGTAVDGSRFCDDVGTPSSIAGAKFWFRSDSLAEHADGDFVTVWKDSSGNGKHARLDSDKDVTEAPTYSTDDSGSLNGHGSVHFAGTNDYLVTDQYETQLSQPNTIFVVAKSTVNGKTVFDGAISGYRNGLYLWNTGFWLIASSTAVNLVNNVTQLSVYKAWTIVFNQSNSKIWTNGTLETVAFSAPGTPGNQGVKSLLLGANQPLSAFLTGDIAELIFYNGDLDSSGDRDTIECYLADKYALTVAGCP